MWLDGNDARNAIRAGLAGPMDDVASLDSLWAAGSASPQHLRLSAWLRSLLQGGARQLWGKHRASGYGHSEPLSLTS